MRPSPIFALLSLLTPLVSSSACVAGGPADEVSAAMECCSLNGGTRYQFYANQAICVVSDYYLNSYNACVDRSCDSELDTQCIPGNGEGLSTVIGSATYTGPRQTITPAARRK